MTTSRDVYVKARELVATRDRWIQRAFAEDAAGVPFAGLEDASLEELREFKPTCFCLAGANIAAEIELGVRYGRLATGTNLAGLTTVLFHDWPNRPKGVVSYIAWNDRTGREHYEVLNLLDYLIASPPVEYNKGD